MTCILYTQMIVTGLICENTGQTRHSCLVILAKSCFEIINRNVASHNINLKVVKYVKAMETLILI